MSNFTNAHQKAVIAITVALDRARKLAARRTAELFPIGSLVFIDSSRGRYTMRVDGHGWYFSDPTTVYGVNVKTGKRRKFYLGCDCVLRVDLPDGAAKKGGAR